MWRIKDDRKDSPGNVNEHYSGDIQPTEFIVAASLSWLDGNVVKYLCRYKKKNGVEDLKKAMWYLESLIEYEDIIRGTIVEEERIPSRMVLFYETSELFDVFSKSQNLGALEKRILNVVVFYQNLRALSLTEAKNTLQELIDETK